MKSNQTIPITKDYKVLVGCLTYNHSKYIVDALNGFAMQKTNFPYVCIVMDDASTDGEPEVITDWLQKECDMCRANIYEIELANVIIVPHKSNANCTMAVYLLKRNLHNEGNLKLGLVTDWRSHYEYFAYCDGDDYWTDPLKLQIQKECLDAHLEQDICTHSFREVSANTGKTVNIIRRRKKESIIPVEDIIIRGGSFLAASAAFYRAQIDINIPTFRKFFNFDYSIYIHGALKGGVYYLNRDMSAYRQNIQDSLRSKMDSDETFSKEFSNKTRGMLEVFDKEYDFQYHTAIMQYLNVAGLNEFIYSKNTAKKNLHYLFKYRKGFNSLPPSLILKILCKCIAPKFGRQIYDLLRHNQLLSK